MQQEVFQDKNESVRFYENRFQHGYMGFWSDFEQKRIFDLIGEMNLPAAGKLLDFGCGRGIFTRVLSQALPGWQIFGCDISQTAVENARLINPQGTFYVIGQPELMKHQFDFIHTHHVLEHVFDIHAAVGEIVSLAAPVCKMLHTLPCNHIGSLEQRVASRISGGINPEYGTFFFEDRAHLRRLSAEETAALFASANFNGEGAAYANQYHGAIKWISESNLRLVLNFTKLARVKSTKDGVQQFMLRLYLVFTWFCFFAGSLFEKQDRGKMHFVRKSFQTISFILFFWLALPVRWFLIRRAMSEWKNNRHSMNGSELFLILAR